MGKQLTNKDFIQRLKQITPNVIPIEEYINNHTKIKCKCLLHNNIYMTTPKLLLNGHNSCKYCISKNKKDRLLRSNEEFLSILQDKNIDVKPLQEYKGNNIKILFECSCGELWNTTPQRVLLGNHCKKCGYKNMIGKNNYFYNPKLSEDDRNDRSHRFRNPHYKNFIQQCFNRDNYTCQISGKKSNGDIVVHHINGYNWDIENRTNINNGITLNKEIHKEFHKLYGKGNNTKIQFIEFLDLLYKQDRISEDRKQLILERLNNIK